MQLVWFKHDLRIADHEPLSFAMRDGMAILLYILEPELWKQPDLSFRHYDFLGRSLNALEEDLEPLLKLDNPQREF